MEGYKNTNSLGKECSNKAKQMTYDKLIQLKTNAINEDDFQNLANCFRNMKGYQDTEALATECENKVFELRYSKLIQLKNQASCELDYIKLAQEFRKMNGYADTNELADECDNKGQQAREKAYYDAVRNFQQENGEWQQLYARKKFNPFPYKKLEDKFQALSAQFTYFGQYFDATNFVNQCKKNAKDCQRTKRLQTLIITGVIVLIVAIFILARRLIN